MPVTIEIITIPIGSIFTSTIASDEAETKNDFQVLLILDGNGTGLTESNITLSSGTLVSLTGKGVSWQATIRPPETAEVITMTIAADAFSEGNVETTHDIRVSTSFPDTDAETLTALFNPGGVISGIAVTPTRLLILVGSGLFIGVNKYRHDGTNPNESLVLPHVSRLDYVNGDILLGAGQNFGQAFGRYNEQDGSTVFEFHDSRNFGYSIAHTRLGYADIWRTTRVLRILPYDYKSESDFVVETDPFPVDFSSLAHQDDVFYMHLSTTGFAYAEILDDDSVAYRGYLNIESQGGNADLSIYGDTLYVTHDNDGIFTLDIRKYRPIAKNTKTTIYPVFANEGDTIDLTQYSPDAERIVADVGFDKPTYLTINTSNELEIDADAVTETHPVYIPLKAINRIDATETGAFGFYLVIQQANAPIWREFDDLSMPADSVFNLFDVVEGATGITLQSGPTGASVSNGRLTIGTQGGTVIVRATNASGNTDHTFIANVVQAGDPDNYSNEFRYRVQIANIDVTSDLKVSPSVSESLDAVVLNESVLDEVSFTLRNDVQNGFRFSDTTPNNFWVANSLTEGGYRVGVKIFVESLVSGSIVQSLLFSGVIFDSKVSLDNADIAFTIVDLSYTFDRRSVEGLGQLTKWDALRQETDEASFEGAYSPEGALTPMQVRTGKAWSDRSAITISDLGLPREGPALANTGYLTPTNFNVSGGFFATPPLLEFKPERRSEDVPYLFQQLGINGAIFNSHVMLSDREADMPFILNRGKRAVFS